METALLLFSITRDFFRPLGQIIYGMFSIFLTLIDWIQDIFRSLAGLGPMRINGEIVNAGEEKYDIVFYLIKTDIIRDIFLSMVVFAIFLMIIMVGLAIIKNSYQDKPKAVSGIIGNAFKGLIGFIFIPVACTVGLAFGNIILQLVDGATNQGGNTRLSANVFLSSAYYANVLRSDDDSDRLEFLNDLLNNTNFYEVPGVQNYMPTWSWGDKLNSQANVDYDALADILDDAVTCDITTENGKEKYVLYRYYSKTQNIRDGIHYSNQGNANAWGLGMAYNLISINYIVLAVGACVILGLYIKMCYGLIGRVFKLCIDYVLIPVVLAMLPWDNGNAVNSWKSDFVKNVVMAYSTVGAINLYFSILPVIEKINFKGSGTGLGFFNFILQLGIQIIGLFSANAIIGTINKWFGSDGILAEGDAAKNALKTGRKTISDKISGTTQKVSGAFGGIVGGAQQGVKSGKSAAGKILKGAMGGVMGGFDALGGKSPVSVAAARDAFKSSKSKSVDAVANQPGFSGVLQGYLSDLYDDEKIKKEMTKMGYDPTKDKNKYLAEVAGKYVSKVNIGGISKDKSEVEGEIKRAEKGLEKSTANEQVLSEYLDTQTNMSDYLKKIASNGVIIPDDILENSSETDIVSDIYATSLSNDVKERVVSMVSGYFAEKKKAREIREKTLLTLKKSLTDDEMDRLGDLATRNPSINGELGDLRTIKSTSETVIASWDDTTLESWIKRAENSMKNINDELGKNIRTQTAKINADKKELETATAKALDNMKNNEQDDDTKANMKFAAKTLKQEKGKTSGS